MKHAIGLRPGKVENGKYVVSRNFYAAIIELPDWENMVQAGIAEKRKNLER